MMIIVSLMWHLYQYATLQVSLQAESEQGQRSKMLGMEATGNLNCWSFWQRCWQLKSPIACCGKNCDDNDEDHDDSDDDSDASDDDRDESEELRTIGSLNQTSGAFRDQPNSGGAFLSSDCLDKPQQVLVNLEILFPTFNFHFFSERWYLKTAGQ